MSMELTKVFALCSFLVWGLESRDICVKDVTTKQKTSFLFYFIIIFLQNFSTKLHFLIRRKTGRGKPVLIHICQC